MPEHKIISLVQLLEQLIISLILSVIIMQKYKSLIVGSLIFGLILAAPSLGFAKGKDDNKGKGHPDTAPVISDLQAKPDKHNNKATITWKTDVKANSLVWFSKTSPVDTSEKPDEKNPGKKTKHKIKIDHLERDNTYYVIVASENEGGKTYSSEISFSTGGTGNGDTTDPVIAAHDNITVEATSDAGAVVTYTSPEVTDNVDATTTASCLPISGSTFPIGVTTVFCNHTDAAGNDADETTFTVTVNPQGDTIPPVIAAHENLTAVAPSIAGAVVTYTSPEVTDNVDVTTTATCLPVSGSTFPFGVTTVLCNHDDAAGNHAVQTSFTVTVTAPGDTTPPVIAAHENITAEATSETGAVVTYISPEVTDNVDATTTATCLPISGSTFPVGVTTVLCNHTDTAGNPAVQTSFTVEVTPLPDTTAPVISEVQANVGDNEVVITWKTDEPSDSVVFFDTVTPVDLEAASSDANDQLVTDHEITMFGLDPDTLYYIVVTSKDASDNTGISDESSFTTNP